MSSIAKLGASGAIPRSDDVRMERHAALFYDAVRKRLGDEERIAKNTGMNVEDIRLIKQHMFLNSYDLGDKEPKRFDPDYDQSLSWQRLIDGRNIQEMDIVLLKHELMECRLMNEKGMSYVDAHRETEKLYDYTKHVKELDLKEGIK